MRKKGKDKTEKKCEERNGKKNTENNRYGSDSEKKEAKD